MWDSGEGDDGGRVTTARSTATADQRERPPGGMGQAERPEPRGLGRSGRGPAPEGAVRPSKRPPACGPVRDGAHARSPRSDRRQSAPVGAPAGSARRAPGCGPRADGRSAGVAGGVLSVRPASSTSSRCRQSSATASAVRVSSEVVRRDVPSSRSSRRIRSRLSRTLPVFASRVTYRPYTAWAASAQAAFAWPCSRSRIAAKASVTCWTIASRVGRARSASRGFRTRTDRVRFAPSPPRVPGPRCGPARCDTGRRGQAPPLQRGRRRDEAAVPHLHDST